MKWKSCETAMSENKEMQRPSHVARLDAAGRRDFARDAALFGEALGRAALGDDALMGSEYEPWGSWVPQKTGAKAPDHFSKLRTGQSPNPST